MQEAKFGISFLIDFIFNDLTYNLIPQDIQIIYYPQFCEAFT